MRRSFVGGALVVAVLALAPAAGAEAAVTEMVDVAAWTTPADLGGGGVPAISADGRYVAFLSNATNLAPGAGSGKDNLFVRDRRAFRTERDELASDGTPADAAAIGPSLSADGRYVAFYSAASNLVAGDSNGAFDVFVHDRWTGVTQRVSVSTAGAEADASSYLPVLSADGRYVAFYSDATNLVPGDTNNKPDVFVHDRQTGVTQRVSVSSTGAQAGQLSTNAAISADGRYVGFTSSAGNLVPGDTNNKPDVFVHDRQTGTTQRVSVSSAGTQGDQASALPSLSADGRYVAFTSAATNLVPGDTNAASDMFVRDLATGTTQRVDVAGDGSQGNRASLYGPSISGDGRYVAFESDASNLVPGDTNGVGDIFRHDLLTGATVRVSVAGDSGAEANGVSSYAAISADGNDVVFDSMASNLVRNDRNFVGDVFVRDFAH